MLLRVPSTVISPKRQLIDRSSSQAQKEKALRVSKVDEQREARIKAVQIQSALTRSFQTNEQ